MVKMMTKTVSSLALVAMAGSLMSCSMEYNKQRDPLMNLSSPSMVIADPPKPEVVIATPEGMVQHSPDMDVTPPMPISNSGMGDQQMMGQPGAGPAAMNPNIEAMPDAR
jgi:hypothetical protein